jgi:hypothetical protein
MVKALIRFCLANQFVPKQPIEDLFARIGISDKTHTPQQITNLKASFKPVVNSKTGETEENEIVRELREKLCIHITWEGRHCFVEYKKSDLDAQSPHAVVFYNPMKPIKRKIKRKELKLKVTNSDKNSDKNSDQLDENSGKKILAELKKLPVNVTQTSQNGRVFGDEPDDFD